MDNNSIDFYFFTVQVRTFNILLLKHIPINVQNHSNTPNSITFI